MYTLTTLPGSPAALPGVRCPVSGDLIDAPAMDRGAFLYPGAARRGRGICPGQPPGVMLLSREKIKKAIYQDYS